MDEDDRPRSPLGEEFVRLLAAAQQWTQNWTQQNLPAATSPDGHTGAECQWCPLCQFVAVLRGDRPEVTQRVAEAGTALAAAFRALVDATAAAPPAAADAADEQADATEDGPGPRVQRIDLDETDR